MAAWRGLWKWGSGLMRSVYGQIVNREGNDKNLGRDEGSVTKVGGVRMGIGKIAEYEVRELGKEKGLVDCFRIKLKEGQAGFQDSMKLVSQNQVKTGIDVERESLKSKCMDDRSSLVKPQAYVSGKSRVDNLMSVQVQNLFDDKLDPITLLKYQNSMQVGKDMVTSEVQDKVELV